MADTILDLDSILDQSMEEVKEAPNFITPENSVLALAVMKVEIAKKKSKEEAVKEGKPAEYAQISATYGIQKVYEQEKDTAPMGVGSQFSETWLAEGKGIEFFKTRACDIAEANGVDREEFGKLSLRMMIESLNGGEVAFKANIKKIARPAQPGKTEVYYNTRIENITAVTE